MNMLKILFPAVMCLISLSFISCGEEDYKRDEPYYPAEKNLTSPKLDKYLTYTDYDGVVFRVRFTNGGDVPENMTCRVHWRSYPSKQTKMPKPGDMNKHENMRIYDRNKYKTTFDKEHAGFTGGTYIYYYFECSNSQLTTNSDMTFCVVKRN